MGPIYRFRIGLALHDGDIVRLRVEPSDEFLVENCLVGLTYFAHDTFHITVPEDIGALAGNGFAGRLSATKVKGRVASIRQLSGRFTAGERGRSNAGQVCAVR